MALSGAEKIDKVRDNGQRRTPDFCLYALNLVFASPLNAATAHARLPSGALGGACPAP